MLLRVLSSRIRSQREKRGLKQLDIANALQVSPQAVSKWERGENAPDIALLAALARLLGVSTDWLLGANERDRDVFEATVLASSVHGAYEKSLGMAPRDFAAWANGLFFQLTEITLSCDGVPLKYMGDGYLCFFSGANHSARAVRTAQRAQSTTTDRLEFGLSRGEIFLGSVGHPDYARPDIMGEVVNLAFLTIEWAASHTTSGIAATQAVLDNLEPALFSARTGTVRFRDIGEPVEVCEIPSTHEPPIQTLEA